MKLLNFQRSKTTFIATLATLAITTGVMVESASASNWRILGEIHLQKIYELDFSGPVSSMSIWQVTYATALAECQKKYPGADEATMIQNSAPIVKSDKKTGHVWRKVKTKWSCRVLYRDKR